MRQRRKGRAGTSRDTLNDVKPQPLHFLSVSEPLSIYRFIHAVDPQCTAGRVLEKKHQFGRPLKGKQPRFTLAVGINYLSFMNLSCRLILHSCLCLLKSGTLEAIQAWTFR